MRVKFDMESESERLNIYKDIVYTIDAFRSYEVKIVSRLQADMRGQN